MSEISITVPEQYTERFKREAVDTLALRAKSLEEAATWRLEGKGDLDRLERDMSQMRAAEEFFAQVAQANGGPLHVAGERRIVVDTIVGCALHTLEDIHGAVEAIGQTDRARAFIAELEEWQAMRDVHGADDGEGA